MHDRPSQWQTLPSSQKCNFKILGWREQPKEILKDTQTTCRHRRNPADILAIHRVPGNRDGGPRPVIVRMISSEAKVRIIKHRKLMEEDFLMLDHITQQNAKLIQSLIDHPSHQSVFALETKTTADTHSMFLMTLTKSSKVSSYFHIQCSSASVNISGSNLR